MLIQFNFENYKSYLNETTLDLTATNISEHRSNYINYKKGEKYLKVVSIYGANASGKSNILSAFNQMKVWVLQSFIRSESNKSLPLKKFQFSEKGKKGTSLFEVFFSVEDKEYQYGFSLDNNKIISEWLYKRNFKFNSKYELVFERDEQKYNLKENLKNKKEILKSMNEKTLLVTFLSRLKNQDAIDVLDWFDSTSVVNFGDTSFEFLISRSLPMINFDDVKEYNRFIDFLTAFDLGIQGVRIEKIDEEYNDSNSSDSNRKYKVFTQHRNSDTQNMEEISLSDESSGTVKMFNLYSYINKTLRNGLTLFVDEMDAKLHPLLTRYIINMFQDEKLNPKNAQLIFTTHDSSTLTNELFRRDQVWFVNKSENGVSELYSLAEYKVNNTKIRKDATYNKDYLGGRYGALPNLSDFLIGE